jgi:hypothetical protein
MAQSPVFTIFNTFDNVSILKCVFLRYPLRGLITDDQWVLSIIQEGYKLEFIEKPPQSGIRKTLVSLKDTQILLQEVNILLEKDAIEPVLNHEKPTGFYNTFDNVSILKCVFLRYPLRGLRFITGLILSFFFGHQK